jgi:hypothetical protein
MKKISERPRLKKRSLPDSTAVITSSSVILLALTGFGAIFFAIRGGGTDDDTEASSRCSCSADEDEAGRARAEENHRCEEDDEEEEEEEEEGEDREENADRRLTAGDGVDTKAGTACKQRSSSSH